MAHLPRGIAPDLLRSQVQNTMPYLFESGGGVEHILAFAPAKVLKNLAIDKPLSHFEYFQLCVSSHYLTCGSLVPTDVDNQIRFKLWPSQVPLETALQMADLVLESQKWDFTLISNRFVCGSQGSDWEKEPVSGQLGEWFTLSSAAYCALKQYSDPHARAKQQELFDSIGDEVRRHSEIFGSLWRANDGLGSLRASAIIAHNFGDLDRVMDMWDLSVADPLRLKFYKLTATPFDTDRNLRYLGRLWVAGELYKSSIDGSSMALENHRHFALRKPKALRRSPELLVPIGPFFDDWGKGVARHLRNVDGTPSEMTQEVVEALIYGWERLPRTIGYGRALRGIQEVHPDLQLAEASQIPAFHSILETPQEKFEKNWNDEAVRLIDDIPSRA